jgi:hypothetical protein
MDVFFETTSGGLAEAYWTNTGGWAYQGLPGGGVASAPSAIDRTSNNMDVFFETTSGGLAEAYWTNTGGWAYQPLSTSYPPGFTSASSATFEVDAQSSFEITSMGDPNVTFSESGTLPQGVTFANNGVDTATLSGTPTETGTFPITITASNGVPPDATQSFSLTVDQAPVLTAPASATFVEANAGSTSVSATGYPTPAFTESGNLPSGVSFIDNTNGTATLSGTPTQTGSFPITITASNGVSPDATQNLTLDVVTLEVTTTTLPAATKKTAYDATLSAEGGATPYKWSLVPGSVLPPGLTLSESGRISGKPTEAGTFTFKVNVKSTETTSFPKDKASDLLSITVGK